MKASGIYPFPLVASALLALTLTCPASSQTSPQTGRALQPVEYRYDAGPRRDDLGDVIRQLNGPRTQCAGLAWDADEGLLWGTNRAAPCRLWAMNPENGQVVHDYEIDQQGGQGGDDAIGLGFDPVQGLFWVNQWNGGNPPSVANLYDRDGDNVRRVDMPRGGHFDFTTDGEWIYAASESSEGDINSWRLYRMNRDGGDVTEGPNLRAMVNAGRSVSICYVPAHTEGHFWLMSVRDISQFSVDWENNRAQRIANFQSNNTDYPHQGITHDGFDLWAGGNWSSNLIYVYDDGIIERYGELEMSADEIDFGPQVLNDEVEQVLRLSNLAEGEEDIFSLDFTLTDEDEEPDWLDFEPAEGTIAPEESVDVTFTARLADIELGEYRRIVTLECNDPNNPEIEIPVHVFVVEGFGRIFGAVSAEGMEEAIPGAIVWIEGTALADTTDENGAYAFDHVPAWTYNVTASHLDFIAHTEEEVVMEPDGEVELNFSLLHSVFVIQPIAVNARLMPDERREIPLTISNPGNGPLEWTAIIAFPQGVDAEPWEMRQAWSAGDTVGDDRIGGVAFAEGRFFVAGSAGNDPNAIYILNRDGSLQGSFVQPGDSRYGMDDLAWDGELLWGSGANYIYAFTTDGDSVTSFRGPNRTTHAIAWDPQREVLWTSDITSRIISISRDGEEGADVANPGMNISGLAFWQADPDGYQLYVSGTAEGVPTVRKVNVETGEWLDAAAMELQEGWSPQGVEITREFDPYSWVFLMLRSIPPEQGGDRIEMWQLLANTSWITYEPLEGVVEPEGELATTLTLDASGVPEDVAFEAQLQFAHNGFGQADTVQVNLTVSLEPANEPPSAFNLLEPQNETYILDTDTTLIFSWEESIDPNPEDTVSYTLWLGFVDFAQPRGRDSFIDSISFITPDNSLPIDIHEYLSHWLRYGLIMTRWWVEAISGLDTIESNSRFWLELGLMGVGVHSELPIQFGLHALYPNPFNSQLRVEFGLPAGGYTSLELFDIAGRRAVTWIEGELTPGLHRKTFAADVLPAGVYMLKLSAGGKVQARKVVLLK